MEDIIRGNVVRNKLIEKKSTRLILIFSALFSLAIIYGIMTFAGDSRLAGMKVVSRKTYSRSDYRCVNSGPNTRTSGDYIIKNAYRKTITRDNRCLVAHYYSKKLRPAPRAGGRAGYRTMSTRSYSRGSSSCKTRALTTNRKEGKRTYRVTNKYEVIDFNYRGRCYVAHYLRKELITTAKTTKAPATSRAPKAPTLKGWRTMSTKKYAVGSVSCKSRTITDNNRKEGAKIYNVTNKYQVLDKNYSNRCYVAHYLKKVDVTPKPPKAPAKKGWKTMSTQNFPLGSASCATRSLVDNRKSGSIVQRVTNLYEVINRNFNNRCYVGHYLKKEDVTKPSVPTIPGYRKMSIVGPYLNADPNCRDRNPDARNIYRTVKTKDVCFVAHYLKDAKAASGKTTSKRPVAPRINGYDLKSMAGPYGIANAKCRDYTTRDERNLYRSVKTADKCYVAHYLIKTKPVAKKKESGTTRVKKALITSTGVGNLAYALGTLAGGGSIKDVFSSKNLTEVAEDKELGGNVVKTYGLYWDSFRAIVAVPTYVGATAAAELSCRGCQKQSFAQIAKKAWAEVGIGKSNNLARIQVEGRGPLASWAKKSPGSYNFFASIITNPVEVYGAVTGGAEAVNVSKALFKGAGRIISSGGWKSSPKLSRIAFSLADDSGSVADDFFNPFKWKKKTAATPSQPVSTVRAVEKTSKYADDFGQIVDEVRGKSRLVTQDGRAIDSESMASAIEQIAQKAKSGAYVRNSAELEKDLRRVTSNGGYRDKVRAMALRRSGPVVELVDGRQGLPYDLYMEDLPSYVERFDIVGDWTGKEQAQIIKDIYRRVNRFEYAGPNDMRLKMDLNKLTNAGGLRTRVRDLVNARYEELERAAANGYCLAGW